MGGAKNMAEEQIINEQQPKQELPIEDRNLMEEIKRVKATTVPKDEYDRVVKRNEELSKAIFDNQQPKPEDKPQESNNDKIKRLNQELYGDNRKEMTNLDFISKNLELRDAIISEGGRDPFLPTTGNDRDSASTVESAGRVANGLQKMVDDAKGSPEAFNALYQARVQDVPLPGRNNLRRFN